MTEHKMFPAVEVKLDEKGYLEAAFAQLNVIDHDGDVTLPGAFPVKDVPMSAYGHSSWPQGGARLPVGVGSISEDGDWAIFKGHFFLATTHGRDAYETVKGLGPLAQYSYGYDVLESAPGTRDGQDVRILQKLDPHEVSPVLLGAGIGTHTRDIKSHEPYADHADRVVAELRSFIDRSSEVSRPRKEGRSLSSANRTRLELLIEELAAFGADIKGLLASTDTGKAARMAEVEYLLRQARDMGLPV